MEQFKAGWSGGVMWVGALQVFVVKTLYTDYTDEDISRCVCEVGGAVSN